MLSDDKKPSHVITTQAGDAYLHFNYFTMFTETGKKAVFQLL